MTDPTGPPESPEEVGLKKGEKLVRFQAFTYREERKELLVFGLLLAGCGIGLVLLYFWWTVRQRAVRAIALTSWRLLAWKESGLILELTLGDIANVEPLRPPQVGTDWVGLVASGRRGWPRTKDPLWYGARGLRFTTIRIDVDAIELPLHAAETFGPLVTERLRARPKNRVNAPEDPLVLARYRDGAFTIDPGDEEAIRAVRGPHGETLLHLARRESAVRALLACGLEPNALDARGRAPLMYAKEPGAIRTLVAAGSDVRHVELSGRTALELRANPPDGFYMVGFCPPPYDELDALLEAGVRPPTVIEAKAWLAVADASVTSAGEATDAREFGRWLALVALPT